MRSRKTRSLPAIKVEPSNKFFILAIDAEQVLKDFNKEVKLDILPELKHKSKLIVQSCVFSLMSDSFPDTTDEQDNLFENEFGPKLEENSMSRWQYDAVWQGYSLFILNLNLYIWTTIHNFLKDVQRINDVERIHDGTYLLHY